MMEILANFYNHSLDDPWCVSNLYFKQSSTKVTKTEPVDEPVDPQNWNWSKTGS